MQAPFSAAFVERLWSEVSGLFTTDKVVSRGTVDVGLGSLANEVSRVFTTWNLKTLLRFRMTTAPQRLETKTPPEHRLGRGSKIERFGTGSAHSASARKRARANVAASPWLARGRVRLDE
jgi:hypothetical protein